MNPLSILSFFKNTTNLIGLVLVIVSVALPFVVSHCKKVKNAKELALKETAEKREEENDTKHKVKVYNQNQKEKTEIVENILKKNTMKQEDGPPDESPPTDEELKGVRGNVLDNFKGGLPQ